MTRDSVFEQTETDFEWIVVDGASTDGTIRELEKINDPRVRSISEPDRGIYDAMNKGMDFAGGEWIWFMNAGDRFYDSEVLSKLKALGGGSDIAYGEAEVHTRAGEVLGLRSQTLPHKVPRRVHFEDFRFGMLISHQAFAVRRIHAPRYNLRYRFGADYDWMLRIFQKATSATHLGVLAIVIREGATTENWYVSQIDRFRIMAKHFGCVNAAVNHVRIIARRMKHECMKRLSGNYCSK